jgi:hypothetical protein
MTRAETRKFRKRRDRDEAIRCNKRGRDNKDAEACRAQWQKRLDASDLEDPHYTLPRLKKYTPGVWRPSARRARLSKRAK